MKIKKHLSCLIILKNQVKNQKILIIFFQIPTRIKGVQLKNAVLKSYKVDFLDSIACTFQPLNLRSEKIFLCHILVAKKKIAVKVSAQNSLMQNRSWLLIWERQKKGTLQVDWKSNGKEKLPLFSRIPSKGQKISKTNYRVLTSSKNRRNIFCLSY